MTARSALCLLAAAAIAAPAAAQDRGPSRGGPASGGPAGVVMEMDPGLALHTIYAPREIQGRLGIVVWGNGGCLNDGANYQDLLREVAAHGFIVIANGAMHPPQLDTQTSAAQLIEAIDWAIAENARAGGKYEGKLDPAKIAAMGHSCGGRQALAAAADPRVATALILNSGASARAPELLSRLHGPALYVSGGPSDRAREAVEKDFAAIAHVPVAKVELDVGHNGTYFEERGGALGRVIVRWLAWRLNGSADAAAWFTGPQCTLCVSPAWRIEKKNIDKDAGAPPGG